MVEPIDFKNFEYKKLRIVSGDLASAEAVAQAALDGWEADMPDKEWTRFWSDPSISGHADGAFVLTFRRPKKA